MTDSKVIVRLRFPLACLIVLLHAQIVEPVSRPIVSSSGFAYVVKILFSEGICRIAVPAFFLISGYLFFNKLEQWDWSVWSGKIKRRFHTLFIPYIFWNMLGIIYLCVAPFFGTVTENLGSILSIFQERGWLRLFWDSNRIMEQWNPPTVNLLGVAMHNGMPANTPLWFIRDLIVLNLLSPFVYALVRFTRQYGIGILTILFVLNIWIPIEGFSITGILFYASGAYFAIYSKGLVDSFKKIKFLSWIGMLVLLSILVITFGRSESALYVQRVFLLFGVVAVFNLAASQKLKEEGICARFADSSFFIYASHIFIINVVAFLLTKAVPGSNQIFLAIKYLLSAALTIVICEGFFQIMKKICPGFLSFICGKRQISGPRTL